MTKTEMNRFAMFLAVLSVIKNNPEIVAALKPLAEAALNFEGALPVIQQRDIEYQNVMSGATAAKGNAWEKLMVLALKHSKAFFAYGNKTGNEQLKAECRITKSYLKRLREGELEQRCARINDLLHTYGAEMAEYDINAGDFSNALEAFRQQSSTKNHKKAESKASRELLSDAFKATDAILKQDLDTIMELVKPENIEFYKQYHASRVIWDIGGSHAPKNGKPETAEPPVPENEPVPETATT